MPRMTFEMNSKMDELLTELAREKDTTKVEVLRRAIALYKYVDTQLADEKKSLAIAEGNAVVKEIVVP
jgi:predicted transcriptional regulator